MWWHNVVEGMTTRLGRCVLMCVLLLSACGYSLVGFGNLPGGVKTLAISRIEAGPLDPLFADALTRELRHTLRRQGGLKLAAEGDDYDALLSVELTNDRDRAVAFDEFNDVLDYTATAAANAKLSLRNGKVSWSRERIAASRGHAAVAGAVVSSSASFQVREHLATGALTQFNNVQLGEERRALARQSLAEDLAQAIFSAMTEDF